MNMHAFKILAVTMALLYCVPAFAEETPFRFTDYKDIPALQAELDKRLPRGTPLSTAEKLLAQDNAFRSDNLIHALGIKNGYSRGSSSEENYVFFFKPNTPAGKEGWEDAKDGWALKVTFFGGGFAIGKMKKPELASNAVISVTALSAPGQDASGKAGESVALAKELLVYKREGQPVETFDEAEWQKLVETNKALPCKDGLTTACLLAKALPLMGMPDKPARENYRLSLAAVALTGGDRETAKMLLKNWPDEAALAAMEKEAKDPARRTPASGTFYEYKNLYPKLLFLSGDYEAAEKNIATLQEQNKSGEDYGALVTLVTAGELDEALKVAKLTLGWKREARDGLEGSSAHMHCENYRHSRPEGMAKLASAFVKAGQLDKAYETTRLLLDYWQNDGYGQTSFCHVQAAERGFVKTMTQLMRAYASKDDKAKASTMSAELQSVIMKQTKEVRRWGKWVFEDTAKAAVETGSADTLRALADFVAKHSEMDYPDVYASHNNDPVPLIYALAGQRDKAEELLSKGGRVNSGRPLSGLESILGRTDANEDTVRLATYFQTINALAEAKDTAGALWFLDKAAPLLEARKKNISEADDIFTFINLGRVFADLGEMQRSRALLDDTLGLLKDFVAKADAKTRFNPNVFGYAAQLYLRHAKLDEVLKWFEAQPVRYDGFVQTNMAAQLEKEDRWEEFDALLPSAITYAYAYDQPSQNMSTLANGLLDKGDVTRYRRFIELLATPPEKLPQTAWTGTRIRSRPATVESTHYLWALTQPYMRALTGKPVPDGMLAEFWPRYINHCKSFGAQTLYESYRDGNRLPDAKETMAGCHVWLVRGAGYFKQWDDRF